MAPSLESRLKSDQFFLFLVANQMLTDWEHAQDGDEDLEQRIELELQSRTDSLIHFDAKVRYLIDQGGLFAVWLEYAPNEWLDEFNAELGSRLIWTLDFAQGRVVSAPTEPEL